MVTMESALSTAPPSHRRACAPVSVSSHACRVAAARSPLVVAPCINTLQVYSCMLATHGVWDTHTLYSYGVFELRSVLRLIFETLGT